MADPNAGRALGCRLQVAPVSAHRRDRSDFAGAKCLPIDRHARNTTRVRSRSPGAFAQGHGEGVMRTALVNGRLLTGERLVSGQTLLLSGARIEALVQPTDSRCADAVTVDLKGQLLLPGFI